VYDIQESLRDPSKTEPFDPKKDSAKADAIFKICGKLKYINPENLAHPLHRAIYEMLQPYSSELTTLRSGGNAWHIGWSDKWLWTLRQYASGLIAVLEMIAKKEELDPKKIALVNRCLVAHVTKFVKALPWHKRADNLEREVLRGQGGAFQESITGSEVVLEEKDAEMFKCPDPNAEKAFLQAKVEELTKKLEEKEKALNEANSTITAEHTASVSAADSAKKYKQLYDDQGVELKTQASQLASLSAQMKTVSAQIAELSKVKPVSPTEEPQASALGQHGHFSANSTKPSSTTPTPQAASLN
jgi:hypothetical protein